MGESIRNCLRRDVDDGNGNGPSREAVHDREEVIETVGRCERYQVHIEMRESLCRDFEIPDRWDHVSRNFGLLASNALSCPAGCVCLDRWPDESFRDCLLCPVNARVS